MQSLIEVHGTIQLFARANARHQVEVKRIDSGPTLFCVIKELLARGGRAAVQVVIDQPGGFEVEFVERVLAKHFENGVRVSIIQLVNMRLQIGVTNIIMDFWADEDFPVSYTHLTLP